jgi:signal transduction histidine kinase
MQPSTETAHADRPSAVEAVARVARALVGLGGLTELGAGALDEIADALGFDRAVMYLPSSDGRPSLVRFGASRRGSGTVDAAPTLTFEDAAWRFLVVRSSPLVFLGSSGWLVENPFEPPAASWLVLPLVAEGAFVGAVMAASPRPITLDPLAITTLSSIGDLLSAGVATARMRLELQRTEFARERMRLAAELHDGLAQDLAAAVRELAFLEAGPPADAAEASRLRLKQAVEAAHRVVRAGLEDLAGSGVVAGLEAAVEDLCEQFQRRGLAVTLERPVPACRLSGPALTAVVRVLNEALANVQRHAQIDAATIRMTARSDGLIVTISDAGVGLPGELPRPGDGHFGVAIMRERARSVGGSLDVTTGGNGGTVVELRVPTAGPGVP